MKTQTTRLAFVTDSHFDPSAGGRIEECLRIHDWLLEDAISRNVNGLLHGGDLWETRTTPAARDYAAAWLQDAGQQLPVVVCRGNHDPKGDVAYLERLHTTYPIHAAERPRVIHDRNLGAIVAVLPWPDRAMIYGAAPDGVSFDEVDDRLRHLLRQILLGLQAQIEQLNPERVFPVILLTHALVEGSIASTGQPLVSLPMSVALDDLALVKPDVVLLGHIHKPQGWVMTLDECGVVVERTVQDGNLAQFGGACRNDAGPLRAVPVIYGGSPYRRTHGELEDKGYVVLTIHTDDDGTREVQWERVYAPCQPMLHLSGRFDIGQVDDDGNEGPFIELDGAPEPGSGADVRVRYTVPFDMRHTARELEAEYETRWTDAGAASRVQWEGMPIANVTARAPEVAEAKTLQEKLDALRRHRGETLTPEREARLLEHLRLLEEAPAAEPTAATGVLGFHRFAGRGIGVLKEWDVDIDALPGPVVAVTGANGAGKSTALEALLIGVTRQTVTRDSFRDLAHQRDSFVSVEATLGGQRLALKHAINGATQQKPGASTVMRDGLPVLEDAKTRTFLGWAKEHMPALDLITTSTFAPQHSAGFLGLDPAPRKQIILAALQIEQVERVAKQARKMHDEEETALRLVTARIDEIGTVDVEALREAARLAKESAEREADVAAAARKRYEAEAEAYARYREAKREHERVAGTRREAATRVRRAEGAHADAQRALTVATDALEAARAGAGDDVATASADLEAARADLAHEETKLNELRTEMGDRAVAIAQARAEETRLKEVLAGYEETCKGRFGVEVAITRAGDPDADLEAAQVDLKHQQERAAAALGEVNRLERERLSASGQRIKTLRGDLRTIATCDTEHPDDYATESLRRDDQAAARDFDEEIREARMKQRQLETDVAEAEEDVCKLKHAVADLATLRERFAAIEKAGSDWREASGKLATATERLKTLERSQSHAKVTTSTLESGIRSRRQRIDDLVRITAGSQALALAEQAHDNAVSREQVADRELKDAQAHLDSLPVAEAPEAVEEPSRARMHSTDQFARGAADKATRAAAALEAGEAAAARLAELQEEHDGRRQSRDDLKRLADELGRNGVQAMEIDAAGPSLSKLTNDLLHGCFGTRWTVEFVTTKPYADASREGEQECYDILVTDTQTGTRRPASSYSGGERTILSEAVSLALTAMQQSRSGGGPVTLVRDESAGALDPDKVEPYVRMLRQACRILGAKVLIVSHTPTVFDLADSALHVADGTLTASN